MVFFFVRSTEVRLSVELTCEKIVDLVKQKFADEYTNWPKVEDGKRIMKQVNIKDILIEYIEERCEEGL